MKIKSGGGIQSNKLVQSQKWKQEPITHKGNVRGVATIGVSTQHPKQPITQGKGYEPSKMGATGIANVRQGHAGAGPGGGGRQIYPRGSQSATPPAREMPKGRDTLSEYGRDIPGRK